MEHDFATSVPEAIFAGWLIALLVCMLPAAVSAHVLMILIMSYLVYLAELLHVIAGATELFYLAFVPEPSRGE